MPSVMPMTYAHELNFSRAQGHRLLQAARERQEMNTMQDHCSAGAAASCAPRLKLLDKPCSGPRCLQHTNEQVLIADANTLKGEISVSFSWTSPMNTFFVTTSRCWTVLPLLQCTDSPRAVRARLLQTLPH